jgi:oxygen-independent coproporphyrinogen-3 oxidase
VLQVHLGGGTPTFLSAELLAELLDGLFGRLQRVGTGFEGFEGSVEADPRVTSPAHLETLRARGFTRLSLGVQDFNADTQQLVNRIQSRSVVADVVRQARDAGYESINFDLIYGLPAQTEASMRQTVDAVIGLTPDRLAVYSFARVPWIKPQQRRFRDDQIPEGAGKRALYETIRGSLLAAGYVELGMDHFARPHDGLARAAAAGTLHRNFQGYTEWRTTALLALGVSGISETPDCYHQNEKVMTVYERRVEQGEIPTLRGHRLSIDDRRRRDRILSLMTTFRAPLDADEMEDARTFLAPLIADRLVTIEPRELRILPNGRPFLRNAAVFFDRHHRAGREGGPVYSRAL